MVHFTNKFCTSNLAALSNREFHIDRSLFIYSLFFGLALSFRLGLCLTLGLRLSLALGLCLTLGLRLSLALGLYF